MTINTDHLFISTVDGGISVENWITVMMRMTPLQEEVEVEATLLQMVMITPRVDQYM